MEYEVRHYVTDEGEDLFLEWLIELRDGIGRVAIERRINRILLGNFGDHKYLLQGVSELRVNVGPGYRVYYGVEGRRIVVLLCGGDKHTQAKDIERACACWQDWLKRIEEKSER